jgi:tricorn protease
MRNGGYFRYPTIAGDTVVFVSEDDAWTVPVAGGTARRLTAGLSEVSRPVLSPDGQWLAFSSRDEHHAEIYVMAADGGTARRVTYLGGIAIVRGWLPDERIVFVSDSGQAFGSDYDAYAVPVDGGQPEALPYGHVRELAFGPSGAVVLGRNTADPARWKRYRGGTAGELWIDGRGTGAFKRLVKLPGNLASPMWIGSRVYFLSDHEGVANVYSCRPTGADLRRHTDHDRYYARWASSDGARIVYQHAAELWLYDPATDASSPIDVDLASPRVQRNRRFVDASRYLTEYAVHPAGHSLVAEVRGKLFSFPLWEEAVHQHGEVDGARYRFSQYTGDGAAIVTVSDAGGEDGLEVHTLADGSVRRFDGVTNEPITAMVAAPRDVSSAAVATASGALAIVDLGTGAARQLDRSPHGALDGITWSPDGRWLAYSAAASPHTRSIRLCEVATGRVTDVTGVEFLDVAPSFDPEGKYLYFLSYRSFDPVYDMVYFDLGFPRAVKPCVVILKADARSPFEPAPKGLGGNGGEGGEGAGAGADDGGVEVAIDVEGIAHRVLTFPVPEARYGAVIGIKGKVLLASSPVAGSLGESWASDDEGSGAKVEQYDLGKLALEPLLDGVSDLALSGDGKTLVYRTGRKLRAIAAGQKPPEGKDAEGGPGRASGWIDLGRVRVSVDPGGEWRQMLVEAWRLQRDYFWTTNMSGVDWPDVRERYEPLVEKVASRAEFSDLMWEMQGELGTSHAYEIGGDHRKPPGYAMGFLGADLELSGTRWRFARIVAGDSWDRGTDSPLLAPGVNVNEGDTLLAIGGRPVGPGRHPATQLVHQAGLAVELTVGDGRGRKPRTVVVKTLPTELPLRYRAWVAANRRTVAEATDGRVGYVHIPDMGPHGYAEFHRAYLAEVDRDALVIDVRYNGGGHVSPLILEKLARTRLGYAVSRWGAPEPYPHESPAGPLVAITNEWAGSDGDIFTHCFKLLGLGPVVGKRTWGGVVGISPTYRLVDGSMTTQPQHAFWFRDVGWSVENYGTDPDYDVDIAPQDYVAGRDPQLEKALELVTRALKRHKPLSAGATPRPVLTPPKLPPRA